MINRQLLLQVPKDSEFEVLRHSNDWLLDYKGETYSEKLQYELTRGLFEEHAKKADIGYANIEKAMVFSLDPNTKEILSLGGSSLLREKKSEKLFENVLQSLAFKHRRIIPDLILDNFGLWFASLFDGDGPNTTSFSVPNDSNTTRSLRGLNSGSAFNAQGNSPGAAHHIKMGSGSTSPARGNYQIQTALGSAPESGYLSTNLGAYTVSNTVIYQGDANPTGGSGTVNEIGSFGYWLYTDGGNTTLHENFMLAHDAVSPGVAYVATKLLRGAYTWQL